MNGNNSNNDLVEYTVPSVEGKKVETKSVLADDEISLKEVIEKLVEWWQYLLSKWVIIVAAGLLGGAIGFTYALFQKPQYTARLTFALEEEKGGGLGAYAGLASQFGIDLGGGGGGIFAGDNLIELMKSRSMIERTLLSEVDINGKKQTLAEYYIDINGLRENWAKKPELSNINFPINASRDKFTRAQDSVLNTITENLKKSTISVDKTDKKLSILAVTCKSENELFSKSLTEGLVATVTGFYTKTKTGRSAKNVAILQNKADSLRNEMNRAMYGRAAAVDQTLNLNPARQTATIPSQRKTIDVQMLSSAYAEVVKNLEISKMALMRDTPLIQVIDEPILPLGKEKFGKMKGLMLGGILAGFLTIIGLLGRKVFSGILEED
ncbi:Wzz/FepE/Etk N-terminal domain-containing protein [Solitalea koreensis]|uniref:Chain length determinant protein n=1 Tax=Solitalea koreensis TaxID=543615 RepID=A0A521CRH2_9SPHI|nr:Wzz/FepE/Etk N-terminal domain-containing protein [Solitalea koreensis]SMO61270.1 Chain length determinant protein [Solitalea koreensis]